jgi:CheY-like chemotaxis protein
MPKTVLIVEDNELNMKLFRDLLEAQDYEVLETREGLHALTLRASIARSDPDGHQLPRSPAWRSPSG